jgi:hypothetical protein
MRRYRQKALSQRETRNYLTFMSGGTTMEAPKRTGRQKEGLVNDAIAAWVKLRRDVLLGRNKRRLATPPGMNAPIMLGWLIDHSADWIGYRRVIVTADMVGKPIAQFVALEAKTENNDADDGQKLFLAAVRDAGGVAGVVRNAQDAELLLQGEST